MIKLMTIPESVKKDTLDYRAQVQKFLSGQTSPVMFKAYRVPMGIYEQRINGTYMVRARVPAGIITSEQAITAAQLSEKYGSGVLHITTRQGLQIHNVSIENTPDVLEKLLEVGLSTRGGGGNTVRNISACPRAGICKNELFDVDPYAIALTQYLVNQKESFNLPRKYKIAFSGCGNDCAFASIADLGFFATVKNGVPGFAVYAGGGLGSSPAVAIKIEEYADVNEIFDIAVAIRNVFDKFGDRINRNKARLRFVVARLGEDDFIKEYKQERAAVSKANIILEQPKLNGKHEGESDNLPGYLQAQKQPGLYSVRLSLKLGDVPASDLIKIADLAKTVGDGTIRTTQDQDLLLVNINKDNIEKLTSGLKLLSIDVLSQGGPKIVACTGAATCKLGLCLSRGLAQAIDENIQGKFRTDATVRISGCPNACGGHFTANIGLQGRASRVKGQLMPSYDVLVGGRVGQDKAQIGKIVGTVPAKRIPAFISDALKENRFDEVRIRELVCIHADQSGITQDFFHDFGSAEPFSLAGRGPGECGAGVTDVVRVDIDEAKDTLTRLESPDSGNKNELFYKAVIASARSLLVTFGLEPKTDREIFAAFTEKLITPGWVRASAGQLIAAAIDWRMGQQSDLSGYIPELKELVLRVDALFRSIGADLKFKIEPYSHSSKQAENSKSGETKLDLRGVTCPLNFVKAKLALEKVEIGSVLEVTLDNGEPIENVPASFAEQGQEIVGIEPGQGTSLLKVRRKA